MTSALSVLTGIAIGGAGGAIITYVITRKTNADAEKMIENLSSRMFSRQAEGILQLAETKFSGKKELIDGTLKSMKEELGKVETLMKELEKDRENKFGELGERLNKAGAVTMDLMQATQGLRQALSGTKSRGNWGERMAEDVLRLAGFVDGVNYVKQTQLETSSKIPDFTFKLPKGLILNMDAKFPFNNYERYTNATTEAEKERYLKEFLTDVKKRVKEVQDRSYINPENNTVDYMLLFIPNEQVYAFIHEQDHTILDEAMKNKIIFCSPLTLYAILSVIRQSIDNFALERKSSDMLSLFGTFKEQWAKFVKSMEDMGKKIKATQEEYDALTTTRVRMLDRPLQKIEQLRMERDIETVSALELDAEHVAVLSGEN